MKIGKMYQCVSVPGYPDRYRELRLARAAATKQVYAHIVDAKTKRAS